MIAKEARALATRVAKQSSNVVVKFGRTNGQPVLHLVNKAARQSLTLADPTEWSVCVWNREAI